MGTDAEIRRINRKGDDLLTAYITANNNSGKALIDKDVKDELNEYKWHVKKTVICIGTRRRRN